MCSNSFLPIDFINRMKQDLGPDFHAFLRSYDDSKISALRFNPLKANECVKQKMSTMLQGQILWSENGYYYDENCRPGIHPYHFAGAYYIQDATAQLPVEMLNPKTGDVVLDLCAAPGGKSTQIAGKLLNEGILVANEPIKNRAKILSENIERLGVKNALVVSEFPDNLKEKFENYFDKILVDAPCSGEGMFRKNHDACSQWSLDNVLMCAKRQLEILECAYKMLIPGGRLCYSTCTFSKQEDEEVVLAFLKKHDDLELIDERRLWPHQVRGEGHYAALIEKKDVFNQGFEFADRRSIKAIPKLKTDIIKNFLEFQKDSLNIEISDNLVLVETQLYLLPENCPDFSGVHVLRAGLHLGTFKKNRFEPSHAFALALKADEVASTLNLAGDDSRIIEYLKGQTIQEDIKDGWCLIMVDGVSIGWGKAVKGMIKNHFPKGLRFLG